MFCSSPSAVDTPSPPMKSAAPHKMVASPSASVHPGHAHLHHRGSVKTLVGVLDTKLCASPPRSPPRLRLDPYFRNHAFLGTFGSYRNGKIVAHDYLSRGVVALDDSCDAGRYDENRALKTAATQWHRLSRTTIGDTDRFTLNIAPTPSAAKFPLRNDTDRGSGPFRFPAPDSTENMSCNMNQSQDSPKPKKEQVRHRRASTIELLTSPSALVNSSGIPEASPPKAAALLGSDHANSPGSALSFCGADSSNESEYRLAQELTAKPRPAAGERQGTSSPPVGHVSTTTEPLHQGELLHQLCTWLPLPRDDPYVGFLRHSPLSRRFLDAGEDDADFGKRSSGRSEDGRSKTVRARHRPHGSDRIMGRCDAAKARLDIEARWTPLPRPPPPQIQTRSRPKGLQPHRADRPALGGSCDLTLQ